MNIKIRKLWREKRKYIIAGIPIIVIVGLIILKLSIVNRGKNVVINGEDEESLEESIIDVDVESEYYYVDIKGAVKNPGVYKMKVGSRVKDVIELAGGLNEDSDTSTINLAKIITDEMVIIIYTSSELRSNPSLAVTPNNDASYEEVGQSSNTSSIVNINTATLEELMTLSGIGETKAKAIISYREQNGNFNSIEEITNVSGIGQAIYEKIKKYITV